MSRPAIIFKSHFKVHDDTMQVRGQKETVNYSNFIQYMDREEAKKNQENEKETLKNLMEAQPYSSGKSVLDYVGNQDKTKNLFDSDHTNLSPEQIQKKTALFDLAQKNQSPMWQNIFSFDNQFLQEEGFLIEGKLDEEKIMKATQESMKHFIQKMAFNDTVTWVGAIHYNTDNIHVHVALVEEVTSRERIKSGKFKGQLKGKVPAKLIRETKSVFANSLINRTNELKRIDELSRHLITDKVGHLSLGDRWRLAQDLHYLLHRLPENRSLWKYRNNVMAPHRPAIDKINFQMIQRYANDDYQAFLKALHDMDRLNERIYGQKNSGQYTHHKVEALNARLGNQLLRNLNQHFPKKEWKKSRTQSLVSHFKQLNLAASQTANALQRACSESKQAELNKRRHRQLEYEKSNRQNEQYQYEYES